MWFEFFKFDLRYQLRQPLLWVVAFVLGALAFGASSSDAIQVGGAVGNVNRNAPVVIAQLLGTFTLISMFIVTIFIAGAVLRDTEIGISDMIFATPMRKHDYLIGRFLAGLVACLAIFAVIAIGIMLGPLMPWVDAARLGPFSLHAYLWSFAVLVIPNLLFIGALLMLLAATTRSILLVYVGVIAFFVLWGVAGAFTRDISNEWIAVLLDPFGVRSFSRTVRYFSAAESNAGLPEFKGFILANRALWTAVALVFFAATLVLFKPQRAGTGRRFLGKNKPISANTETPRTTYVVNRITPVFSKTTAWAQCWSIFQFDAKAVFKSVPFLVMLLFAVANFVGSVSQGGLIYGTAVYPVTRTMLEALRGSFYFMLVIILIFYAGELIFKERQAKLADVIDAMPAPNWAPLLAKSMALIGVIITFLAAGVLAAIGFQLIKGGAPIELSLYIQGVLLSSTPFILLGLIAVALQVLINNKFIGYLFTIVLVISQIVLDIVHLEHNLYNIAGLPSTPYSDMNGYGHFLEGWRWFALYWSFFVLTLLVVAQAFWVRGLSNDFKTRTRLALQNLRGRSGWTLALCLCGFIGTGGWIFYNTNILNTYLPSDARMDLQANYEKKFKQYQDLPHPKLIDVKAEVDIFPTERKVNIAGHYILQNRTDKPLDTLRIQRDIDVKTAWRNLPPHQVKLDEPKYGFQILQLATPLAPGDQLALDFDVVVTNPGFTNSGVPNSINLNGTFFNNANFFPHFGYNNNVELIDRNERRKRGLGEPTRMAKLEDQAARANNVFGAEADWINFETTISTSADQIALAPGYLQKTWEENGRRYFHYKMDQPMVSFFAYLSARWEVKKALWKDLPIEIYYDKKHAYNVDKMIEGTQKSLDYFTTQFTPYQHKQVRILEFPSYQTFAQSFANTIPFSEGIGFIADLRNKDDVDYVFYVTAHEVAHQWWGHQVVGAATQGSTMLIESLAQYSAMMVMEKEYGKEKMRRYLKYELDRYLSSRSGEQVEEQPLYRVENQQYIHYRKGSLVFYRLRDEIGEDALNRALQRFLKANAFQTAPYTNSQALLDMIRAEAPQDKQALITDLFEKIVFYDNRVVEAKANKRADGLWDVTMKLHLAKFEADGKGKETARSYDEPVEIAVFARAKGAKEKDERVLFIEKRVLQGNEPSVTITVKEEPFEVGVDPYNKMIDRVSRDNRKEITLSTK